MTIILFVIQPEQGVSISMSETMGGAKPSDKLISSYPAGPTNQLKVVMQGNAYGDHGSLSRTSGVFSLKLAYDWNLQIHPNGLGISIGGTWRYHPDDHV